MRIRFVALLAATLFILGAGPAWGHPHILALAGEGEITFAELMDELEGVRLVFVGELHDHEGHHQMQLEVIRALGQRGGAVAVGLEMFKREDQGALDRWVAQELEEAEFLPIYQANWSMWPLYRPIFLHAREKGIPLLGLNIPREISGRVAREGFASLTDEQRRDLGLGGFSCFVSPAYEEFIRRALGGHAHTRIGSFTNFCQAQLLWDRVMAVNLLRFLAANPEHRVVVLVGNGHAWKHGIPAQLAAVSDAPISYRVVMPEIPGRIDRASASVHDADFLWLDSGPDGWRPAELEKGVGL
ncbi:ChaN family lipoprotein [Desulfurivibrio sp. D14AmB]|uniref:ChaN family lipoprotein n=1 Tax=Desulfurivibrio sp. D14AmB TaxID=3374370 RepID=UPI00376EB4B2